MSNTDILLGFVWTANVQIGIHGLSVCAIIYLYQRFCQQDSKDKLILNTGTQNIPVYQSPSKVLNHVDMTASLCLMKLWAE